MLKQDSVFSCYPSRRLERESNRIRGQLQKSKYYHRDCWSEADVAAFNRVLEQLNVDLSKLDVPKWAERMALKLNSSIPTIDISKRLFNLKALMLEQEGVVVNARDVPDVDDDAEDRETHRQRCSVLEAAASFARGKKEGPVICCVCCGQLSFKNTMHKYTNRRHCFGLSTLLCCWAVANETAVQVDKR